MSTSFDERVYTAIQKIPRGQVRSYQWVAERIGQPRAARAVGLALNRNPQPVVVPCHRVIRKDGSLGGYAFGQQKKKALLRREGYAC